VTTFNSPISVIAITPALTVLTVSSIMAAVSLVLSTTNGLIASTLALLSPEDKREGVDRNFSKYLTKTFISRYF